ncbi:MAG: hypothetical protein GXP16_13165 [Gammaproteobacteria bacterium]|nr:hypothetical protein [Gammaproteobacteria bacterium]
MLPEDRATKFDLDRDSMDSLDLDTLQAEVNKWQERVPKLAAALRERTEELAEARTEIRRLNQIDTDPIVNPEADDARLKARDDLIRDLEEKSKEYAERHRTISSQLHSSQIDLTTTREECDGWKKKWQEVTSSLDSEFSTRSAVSQELQLAQQNWTQQRDELEQFNLDAAEQHTKEIDSLRGRNSNLLETTELANKQLATLSDEMSQLIGQVNTERAGREQAQQETQIASEQVRKLEIEHTQELQSRDVMLAEHEEDGVRKQLELTELRTHNQRQEKANGGLRQELIAANRQLEESVQVVQSKQLNMEELETKTQTLSSSLSVSLADVESIKTKLTEVQQTNSELEGRLQKFKAEMLKAAQREELETADSGSKISELSAQVELLQNALNSNHDEMKARADELEQARSEQLQQADEEIKRLTLCLEAAQSVQVKSEDERRTLTEQLGEDEIEKAKLKKNLDERSTLVRELEEEQLLYSSQKGSQQEQLDTLQIQLTESQHRQETFQVHAQKLEEKLTSQQELMGQLEAELSDEAHRANELQKQQNQLQRKSEDAVDLAREKLRAEIDSLRVNNEELEDQLCAHEETVQELTTQLTLAEGNRDELNVAKSVEATEPDGDAPLVSRLQREVRELEGVVRLRTEELDDFKWRSQQGQSTADESVVMILNQQLKDARDENERLNEKITVQANRKDDLTKLKGVGEKLAQQLSELGVTQFAQIAQLSEVALNDEEHCLHTLRNRIIRDEWIEQARSLLRS